MQKAEITSDTSSPKRKCVTRKNTRGCLLILGQFEVSGSNNEDMKARNGKSHVALSLLTIDITTTIIKTTTKDHTLFLQ